MSVIVRRRTGLTRRGLGALALPALIMMAGCSGGGLGSLIAPAPIETFDLSIPRPSGSPAKRRGTIAIAESSAVRALDTERILVKPRANEINYLAGAQWADRLPRLVQSRARPH